VSAFGDALRAIRQGRFDQAGSAEKDASVDALIYSGSAAAGLVALQPVPFLDLLLLLPIHLAMFQGIGRVRGYHLDKKSALEMLTTWRRSMFVQQLTVAVPKLVPVLGWAFAAASAQALTYALGQVADYYFRTGRSMVPAEIRAAIRHAYRDRLDHLLGRDKRERVQRAQAWARRARGRRRHTLARIWATQQRPVLWTSARALASGRAAAGAGTTTAPVLGKTPRMR
jgi:uncharacterized protein (DUF697 family)